jgi:hypothetical protein
MQKQDTVILATNGIATSRAIYQEPATIAMLVQCPAFNTESIGTIVYTIHYVFSG